MVTKPYEKDPGVEPRPVRLEHAVREVVAGDSRGAIRRIVLYTAAVALALGPRPRYAVVPLTLLVATDKLV